MSASRSVLLTGVTGKQGSAALSALKAAPESASFDIRALVRDPTASGAKKVESQGVSLYKGTLTDRAALEAAMKGVDTGFLFTIPIPNPEDEITQGKTFIDAAKATGVKHIVFSSVGSAERNTGIPHFDSKRVVEQYLIASGIQYTIIRPVGFMENVPLEGIGRFMVLGMFRTLLNGKKLQLIAAEDIGVFAAKAILDPEAWAGKQFELAGDERDINEMLDAFEQATGSRPWTAWLPFFLIKLGLPTDFWLMFKFFREDGYKANIPTLRAQHPGLLNYKTYIEQNLKNKSA